MNIVTLGVNHKTAPVEVRECLAFAEGTIPQALKQLQQEVGLQESMILSTCNRVEIYGICEDTEITRNKLVDFIGTFKDLPAAQFTDSLYYYCNQEAIQHVFQVASSLDSMVIGEPQILGQLKEAYALASEHKATGLILNKFMHRAFSVAKSVRTRTKIANSAVSVSFAAVEMARKIFGDLSDKTVMLVGAGEMCELAARHFVNQGVKKVLVTNRTYQRARQLADEFDGSAIEFKDFHSQLQRVDILLTSTGSPSYLIKPEHLGPALKKRKHRPIFLIDIAVPRDIDPATNNMDGIFLYDVDDLQDVVTENIDHRKQEAERAEALVDIEVEKFIYWLESLQLTPTIKALHRMADEISRQELEKTLSSFPDLSKKQQKKLEAMARAIVNKLLHQPITFIKEHSEYGEQLPAEIVRQMYKLNDFEQCKQEKPS